MSFSRIGRIALHGLAALVMISVFALLFGWVVMQAWNTVIPGLWGWPAITFWQAVALLILARVLVGRFTHHGHSHGSHRCFFRRCRDGGADNCQKAERAKAFDAHAASHLGGDGHSA